MEPTQTLPTSEAPSDDARTALTAMADRLTRRRPNAAIQDPMRIALALTHATDRHGFRTPAADELEAEILTHAPKVRDGQTRGEYAALLRLIANGVTS